MRAPGSGATAPERLFESSQNFPTEVDSARSRPSWSERGTDRTAV